MRDTMIAPHSADAHDTPGGLRGSRVAEQYRGLRAVIEADRAELADHGQSSIAVLVVGVEHGAAEVGIRLAAAFADGGSETLLLDADMASPACHRLLQSSTAPLSGLSEWLRADEPRPLPTYASNVAGLSVLPAGQAASGRDPLQSVRIEALFAASRSSFARIVVVAPPVAASADALFLSPRVDGVILAVVPGKTSGPGAQRARDSLLATGGRLYGAVFADADGR